VEEITRFFELERRLLERVSTRWEAFEFGVGYLDEDCPERYYSSFLLVDTGLDDATAVAVAESAERILGGADLRHRLVVVNDDRLADRLAPAFATLGYTPSWDAILSHRRGPDRVGDIAVDEVPFAEVRRLISEMYRQDPDVANELAEKFTEQQGKKEGTIGARFFVGNVDGQRAGNCELYVDGLDAQVENVGTLEEFRGRGVGRSVVLRAVEAARESGAQHIFIVTDDDDWPKDLYGRLGFEQIGRTGQFLLAPTSVSELAPR
jgi:ribosomal protein S18 acetylase RimI-like enzyme